MSFYKKFKDDFKGKRVLIFGLGLIGRGVDVAREFTKIGCQVLVTDRKTKKQLQPSVKKLKGFPIKFTLGKHLQKDIDKSDVIIRNPDVEWHHPLLERARRLNIPIYMDTSLFAKYFPGTLIGITGTRGKTTATMLIYELLKIQKKRKVILAGNTTTKANVSLLKKSTKNSIAVAELSSWELQGFKKERISPQIAVVTNVYQDHMDHYRSFSVYVRDKEAIFLNQNRSDHLLLNKTNSWTKKMAQHAQTQVIWFTSKDFPSGWKIQLKGEHNLENAAAAYKVASLMGLQENKIKKVFEYFKPVPNRLETVGKINGIEFINDTTSTTPIATIKAIQAFQKPIIILVGGNSKKLPIENMAREIARSVKSAVLLKGTGTEELEKMIAKFGKVKILSRNLPFERSVEVAIDNAISGDVVLLSPGFTSFAEFNNIFERGKLFKKTVKNLSKR